MRKKPEYFPVSENYFLILRIFYSDGKNLFYKKHFLCTA